MANKATKIKPQATSAGGITSLTSAARQVWQKSDITTGIKAVKSMNKLSGFDCPGCAWPTAPEEALSVEICENGIKALAEEISLNRADSQFFAANSLDKLRQLDDYNLGLCGRLTEPMMIKHGETHYTPISWDNALTLISDNLKSLSSPNQASFYTSGRTSNEAAFLYQLMVRKFGTNNLPDSADLCHEASGIAMTETIGIGKGSVTMNDFYKADAIFIFGQNPGSNHPRMLKSLQKAANNGCKIISINPLIEAGLMRFKNPQNISGLVGNGSALSDLLLQVKINGDFALVSGILKAVFEYADTHNGQGIDKAFIADKTHSFEEFRLSLDQISWADICLHSGITENEIRQTAEIFCKAKRVIICWAMGLTQHHNGVDTIKQVVNLLLVGGHLGREGAGVCPVRGHSNVQGDKTMGITENPPAYLRKNLETNFGFVTAADKGLDTISTIQQLINGNIKSLIMLGGNLLMAAPDTHKTAQALANAELTVHIATKLNHTHLYPGKIGIILPCLARSEKDPQHGQEQLITVENSMGIVHRSSGVLTPCSDQLRSEIAIIANLAAKIFPNDNIPWLKLADDYSLIRDLISQNIPGFDNFNQKIQETGWFYLPNLVRDKCEFSTVNQKANFTVNAGIDNLALKQDEFILMTTRSHDQFNTTISGLDDRYRGIYQGRLVLFMNREDIQELGLNTEHKISLINSQYPEMKLANLTIVPYDIPRRCLASYFPEANVLIPLDSIDQRSRTPTSKSIKVRLCDN